MIAQPDIYSLEPRTQFLPPPGPNFITDVVNDSPMRQLALDSVGRERNTLFLNRMAQSGPPTPNQPPPGMSPPNGPMGPMGMMGQPEAQTTMPAPTMGDASAPQPPAPAPGISAGPRLLSPPEWAAKFMPNLAAQPYISARQQRLLMEGYKAYQAQVSNDQTQAHWAQQEQRFNRNEAGEESRFNRGMDVRSKELDREITRENRLDTTAASREAAAERRHQEDISSREKIAGMRKTTSAAANPMNALTGEAIDEMKAQGMKPKDILAKIAADKRSEGSEPSFLDRKQMGDELFGGSQIMGITTSGEQGAPGLLNGPEWETDPMKAFQGLQTYVARRMMAANDKEKGQLRKLLKAHAPYKTPKEVAQAFQEGKFDAPEERGALGGWFLGDHERPEVREARHQAGREKAKEYLRSVFTPEEIQGAVPQTQDQD